MGDDGSLTSWLLAHGGPAIRYRTATDLLDAPTGPDLTKLVADLLASPMT